MSDHSLVFRLPCHHIFHSAPSLNWACIIMSYHVEYLITASHERWLPTIPLQTDTTTHICREKKKKDHAHTHQWSYGTQIQADSCVCVHFCTSCLQYNADGMAILWQVRWCVFQECPVMFISTAASFCDHTKDALEPAVLHLQVTIKMPTIWNSSLAPHRFHEIWICSVIS